MTALAERVDDEQKLASEAANQVPLPPIHEYYWASRKGVASTSLVKQPRCCGISAAPVNKRASILPQLLMLPTLIVDILPLDPTTFAQKYGVTVEQMKRLASLGHVVPSMYHYNEGSWTDYEPHSDIADLLAQYGRANSEWITNYLNKRFNYKAVENNTIDWFKSIPLDDSQRGTIVTACYQRFKPNQIEKVLGQRLAYVKILADRAGAFVDYFETMWEQSPAARAHLARILDSTKHLVATETTAAFGGYVVLPDAYYKQIGETICSHFKVFLPSHRLPAHVASTASVVNIPASVSRHESATDGVLSPDEFDAFVDVLMVLSDGRLCRTIDELIMNPLQSELHQHAIEQYHSILDEIGNASRSMTTRVQSYLADAGVFCFAVHGESDEMLPEFDWSIAFGIDFQSSRLQLAAPHMGHLLDHSKRPWRVYVAPDQQ